MFRLASIAALLAGSVGLVAAQSYADFPLDTSTTTTFAGTIEPIETYAGGPDVNRPLCNAIDNCIGFICLEDAEPFCILLKVGDITDNAEPGFTSIHWRYDTPSGPSCSSTTNNIATFDGACTCDAATEDQNTVFGCLARQAFPSQAAALRQRAARNKIMPGMVKKAVF